MCTAFSPPLHPNLSRILADGISITAGINAMVSNPAEPPFLAPKIRRALTTRHPGLRAIAFFFVARTRASCSARSNPFPRRNKSPTPAAAFGRTPGRPARPARLVQRCSPGDCPHPAEKPFPHACAKQVKMGIRGGGKILSTQHPYSLKDEEDSLSSPSGLGTTTVVFRVFANRFQSRQHLHRV